VADVLGRRRPQVPREVPVVEVINSGLLLGRLYRLGAFESLAQLTLASKLLWDICLRPSGPQGRISALVGAAGTFGVSARRLSTRRSRPTARSWRPPVRTSPPRPARLQRPPLALRCP
jgi:hypothetical protein